VANAAVDGETTADGLARLPDVIAAHPYAQYYLLLYGTNDTTETLKSGLGLAPTDERYAGTYKDLMQQMINMIRNAGKTVYLAKLVYTSNVNLQDDLQAYNAVIDELVALNGISVVPPDFYSYFAQHPEQKADLLHPNGLGYQSMANMWFDALIQGQAQP
jgi:lysophospholipase L1-like esterase